MSEIFRINYMNKNDLQVNLAYFYKVPEESTGIRKNSHKKQQFLHRHTPQHPQEKL